MDVEFVVLLFSQNLGLLLLLELLRKQLITPMMWLLCC